MRKLLILLFVFFIPFYIYAKVNITSHYPPVSFEKFTHKTLTNNSYKSVSSDISNKIKYLKFFILGGLFIILIFCLSLYLNKVVDREYIIFGFFIGCTILYFLSDSMFFYESGLNNQFLKKLNIIFMFLLLVLTLIFIFNVSKIPITGNIKWLLFITIISLFFIHFINNFTLVKLLWGVFSLVYISICLHYTIKIYKTENLPELINGIIGLIIFLFFIILDITGVLPDSGFKYGILLFILCIINGLTKRFSRIKNELKEFSTKLITERDGERKKLGKELHDGLGQLLIATKLNLQMLSKKNKDLFQKIIEEISMAINELRNICENLKPAVLENMGLAFAIEYYLDKYAKKFKVDFQNNLKDESNISSALKENLF